MKPKKQKKEDRKWVVYTTKFGKTEIGIYQLHVTVDGTKAFIHPRTERQQADVIPAANVFDTKEAAQNYLSNQGKRMWVIVNKNDVTWPGKVSRRVWTAHNVPMMFEALVMEYTYHHAVQGSTHGRLVKPLRKATFSVEHTYNVKVFATKKEAETEYAHRWKHEFDEVQKILTQYHELEDALLKNPPRSKKKKPCAGPKEAIVSQTHGD